MDEVDLEKSAVKHPAQEPAKFDEAPGEAEANAVRDAFLKNIGKQPQSAAQPIAPPAKVRSAVCKNSMATLT